MSADRQQNVMLFTYVIASGDMRFIERTEREIHLLKCPDGTMVIRGEIPDCGPDASVGLEHILLEYAMSCEDCREQTDIDEAIAHFGKHLAHALAAHVPEGEPDSLTGERLASALGCILNSMDTQFTTTAFVDRLEFQFASNPLHQAAEASAMRRRLGDAQRALVVLCQSVVHAVAPDWELVDASPEEGALRLRKSL